jgi:hypothetical protein
MTTESTWSPSLIPEILDSSLPFPATCHPLADTIERDAIRWVSRYAPAHAIPHLEKTRSGRIVARTVSPDASVELLTAYSRMLAWGFWFDDEFVDDAAAGSPLLCPAITSVLDILDHGCGTGAAGARMEEAFTDVVDGLRAVLPPAYFARWCCEMRLWFCSMVFQNRVRAIGGTPSAAEYKTIRLYTVCSFACIVLVDSTWQQEVAYTDYYDPDLTALRISAANVVAWQNDIFSFYAEQAHPGRFWNLPEVYAAHGCSIDEAMLRTAREAAEEAASFIQRETALKSHLGAGARAHMQSLKNWMRGCHDWSREAVERYTGWQRVIK